jgi:hypothetical protein
MPVILCFFKIQHLLMAHICPLHATYVENKLNKLIRDVNGDDDE